MLDRAEAEARARSAGRGHRRACASATSDVTGMAVFFQMIQNINVGGRITKSEYQYTLQSSDTDDALPDSRRRCATRSPSLPGLLDVNTDLYITNPQVTIEVDREKAAVYGITIDQVRQELFNAFGTRQVATIYTPTNDYQVILETKPEFRADPSSLSKIFVKTNGPGAATWHRRRATGRAPASPATASRPGSRSRCRR